MDVIGGLTAARLAFDLAKDLQGIDRSVDEAAFKLKLAELTSALADTQVALADAKIKIMELETELSGVSLGSLCPVCLTGRLKVMSVRNGTFVGTQVHSCECESADCSYKTDRSYDGNVGEYRKSRH